MNNQQNEPPDLAPYIRVEPTPEQRIRIAKKRRKFKRKMAWRTLRERIARFIFRF